MFYFCDRPNLGERQMDEDIVFKTKQHWIIFAWPIAITVAGLLILFFLPFLAMVGWMFLAFGIICGLIFYAAYSFSTLLIRRKSILIQTGLLARQSVNLPVSKVETIEIRQSLLGAVLNYGVVVLVGTGGTRTCLSNIAHPLTCRRHMERLINSE